MNIDTNIIINGFIILLAVWMFARRLLPAKGVRNISTNELKAELGKKISNILMSEQRRNFALIIYAASKIFPFTN
jgi:hypothetical protein